MSTQSLVVKAYRPWRYRIAIVLLLGLALAAIAYSYNRGLNDGGYFRGEAQAEQARMEAEIETSEETERRLREQVAVLERAQEVAQASRENLRRELLDMQDEIQDLREELAFYRGIVSPEDGQRGLQLQDFSLQPTAEPREYEYSLMLIQALSHDRRVEGEVDFTVLGEMDGESRSLSLEEVSNQSRPEFSFRYFQSLDGRLELPEGFEPRAIEVQLSPSGSGEDMQERFEWPAPEG